MGSCPKALTYILNTSFHDWGSTWQVRWPDPHQWYAESLPCFPSLTLPEVSASFTGLWRKTVKASRTLQRVVRDVWTSWGTKVNESASNGLIRQRQICLQCLAPRSLSIGIPLLEDLRKVLQRMLNKGKVPEDIQECLKQATLPKMSRLLHTFTSIVVYHYPCYPCLDLKHLPLELSKSSLRQASCLSQGMKYQFATGNWGQDKFCLPDRLTELVLYGLHGWAWLSWFTVGPHV